MPQENKKNIQSFPVRRDNISSFLRIFFISRQRSWRELNKNSEKQKNIIHPNREYVYLFPNASFTFSISTSGSLYQPIINLIFLISQFFFIPYFHFLRFGNKHQVSKSHRRAYNHQIQLIKLDFKQQIEVHWILCSQNSTYPINLLFM